MPRTLLVSLSIPLRQYYSRLNISSRETMTVLNKSKVVFKAFGYCFNCKIARFCQDYWASVTNTVISMFFVWVNIVGFEFLFSRKNTSDDRIFKVEMLIAFFEIAAAHFTLSRQKCKTCHFFEQIKVIVNRST